MKRIHLVLIAGLFASLVAGVASAGTPRIDRREARQHARIVQGRRSGALDRAQDRQNRTIYRLKHNRWRA